METILITGSSWFIWFHLAKKLLELWHTIIGIDNENDYYDPTLKHERRKLLESKKNFNFFKWSIKDKDFIDWVFSKFSIDKVCNLAAQAWVRYSIENPQEYIDTNIVWFHNVLFAANQANVNNFVYASSSSVYWKNTNYPYSITDTADNPISLYAATKKSNELIAHTYSHLFNIQTVGLRFFTVYWPWWRPDMAYFKFAEIIKKWWTIDVYNQWDMRRDFTYIDDIIEWIILSLWYTVSDKEIPYQIFNLWFGKPEKLESMIDFLQKELWSEIKKNYMDMQPGDVYKTAADITETTGKLNRKALTSLSEWIAKFVHWYKQFNKLDI
jgi:UDP-glucuronate 4-epimerase